MTRRQSRPPHDRLSAIGAELARTRRWLPHWQQGGATYFVTFRAPAVEVTKELRPVVLSAIRYFDGRRYTLWSAVVMPDHVHVLLTPLEAEPGRWWSVSSILHSLKSYTANQVNARLQRTGVVWMQESFDRIVRDEGEFIEKWQYIRNNPVKRGLCERAEEWDGFWERAAGWPAGGTG
jgi:putative transposase